MAAMLAMDLGVFVSLLEQSTMFRTGQGKSAHDGDLAPGNSKKIGEPEVAAEQQLNDGGRSPPPGGGEGSVPRPERALVWAYALDAGVSRASGVPSPSWLAVGIADVKAGELGIASADEHRCIRGRQQHLGLAARLHLHRRFPNRGLSEPDARYVRRHGVLDDQRFIDTDLCGIHDAGRRDQADHERAVERGRQGDRDDPAGGDRMSIAYDQVSVASGQRPIGRSRAGQSPVPGSACCCRGERAAFGGWPPGAWA
jgi:hypothetical protein